MSILLTSFSTSVHHLARGSPQANRLIRENKEAWKVFKMAIRGTVPNFRPFVDARSAGGGGDGNDGFENRLADEEDELVISTAEPIYLKDMRKHLEK
jgi:hypothetical protein